MGNTREWTTKFNARNAALSEFVKSRAGRSMSKRKAAVEKAATMPLSRQSPTRATRATRAATRATRAEAPTK